MPNEYNYFVVEDNVYSLLRASLKHIAYDGQVTDDEIDSTLNKIKAELKSFRDHCLEEIEDE